MDKSSERHGAAFNEYRNGPEFLALRAGQLRVLDSDTLRQKDAIFVRQGFACMLRPDCRLEMRAEWPVCWNYVYRFENEKEQLAWFDAFQQMYPICPTLP